MTQYQFKFTQNSEKDFASLPKALQKRIYKKLQYWEMLKDPMTLSKKLEGLSNCYRFRVGDYRIIVSPENENLLIILVILKIAHRKSVYDSL